MNLYIGQGHVFHQRHVIASNGFQYPTYFMLFNCSLKDEVDCILKKHFHGVFKISEESYLKSQHGNLLQEIQTFLKQNCQYQAEEIWLQTIPKLFGYAFNPVSFWYCYENKILKAVLVEVNNTFGERHFYWIQSTDGIQPQQIYSCKKEFHVSPFFPVNGYYQFRFNLQENQIRVDINYFNNQDELQLTTHLQGQLRPHNLVRTTELLFRYGWLTPMIWIRIHWQALILFIKKVSFYRKPEKPKNEVTR